jgi:hypothetical protein
VKTTERVLSIERIEHGRDQLRMHFRLDDLGFTTSYWYEGVDLYDLERRFGEALMRKLYFHVALFEVNKIASLRPDVLDVGSFAALLTPELESLWRTVFHHVWAQWRYEHDAPDYEGPRFVVRGGLSTFAARDRVAAVPMRGETPDVSVLSFCGGGKDSLVAMKLLERAGVPFASYAYAHSIYGAAAPQMALIDRLLDHGKPARRHRQWVYDDFVDSPVLALHPEYAARSLTAAETPSSIFGVLPVVLAHGYRHIALAHEKSANVGNLVWDKTGEDVNHQWGKSLAAETLINEYLKKELVADVSYFSVLQPIYDVVIFRLLAKDLDAVPSTHSCNVKKPWCKRCPKCAYVWLGYQAHLPSAIVDAMFGENLFELAENQLAYRQMLGLEAHTPFECIGQIDEARLAFELCRRKGMGGAAMRTFVSEVASKGGVDVARIAEKYLAVDASAPTIPESMRAAVVTQMQDAADQARRVLVD